MRRHADTETLPLLAELEWTVPPEVSTPPPPAPPPPEVKPPANFRELVAQRQAAFHAGQRPVWMEE